MLYLNVSVLGISRSQCTVEFLAEGEGLEEKGLSTLMMLSTYIQDNGCRSG